ncbi:vacuolar fusion protein MON1 B-like [Histomonas meleagridis]|uniref:vacuolar fusion protein MON1-like B-like n=1 Tax=Histomonas meleagridis TaxID=135588 RepID=UPI003559E651|nr:vacuolar fusion protein MON1 B-like [Histomonas meleagridis]KAH0803852.1 vacuolar fusion protein MON1-like B-like [Histomonas meleagridis]
MEAEKQQSILPSKVFPSTDELKEIRCFSENPRDISWTNHKKHFFILTDASRPVYCRYGNEVNITPLVCTIVAFVGQLTRDGGQKIQKIVAGDRMFIFYLPLPFIFACVSSVQLPDSLIIKELQVLELEIFSILTPEISTRLKRRPNFDIKRQTQNSERFFTSALYAMDNFFTFIFHDCIPMAPISNKRKSFSKIVKSKRPNCVSAAVIFYQGDVFFTIETAAFHLTTDDIRILSTNVYPPASYENCWTPIWLPSHTQMFHILTYGVNEYSLQIILISEDIEAQYECIQMAEGITSEFIKQKLKLNPIPPFKDETVLSWAVASMHLKQVCSPFMQISELSEAIYKNYAWTYEYLKGVGINGEFYLANEEITVFGVHSNEETIIAAAPPGTTAAKAQELIKMLRDYVEENRGTMFDLNPLKWD